MVVMDIHVPHQIVPIRVMVHVIVTSVLTTVLQITTVQHLVRVTKPPMIPIVHLTVGHAEVIQLTVPGVNGLTPTSPSTSPTQTPTHTLIY